jgi:hypothetical protein
MVQPAWCRLNAGDSHNSREATSLHSVDMGTEKRAKLRKNEKSCQTETSTGPVEISCTPSWLDMETAPGYY